MHINILISRGAEPVWVTTEDRSAQRQDVDVAGNRKKRVEVGAPLPSVVPFSALPACSPTCSSPCHLSSHPGMKARGDRCCCLFLAWGGECRWGLCKHGDC